MKSNLKLKNIRFSIEIEAELPKRGDSNSVIEHHRSITGWMVKWDGSLNNGGVEYCPKSNNKLYFDRDSLIQIKELLGVLSAHNAKTSIRCGGHIHISAEYFSNKELCNIIKSFIIQQDNIVKLFKVHKKRLTSVYGCNKIPIESCSKITEKNINKIKRQGFYNQTDPYLNDRHYLLNILSLNRHGTLEFRLFNSTLDYDEILRNIKWCIRFCLDNRK